MSFICIRCKKPIFLRSANKALSDEEKICFKCLKEKK